MKTFPAVFAGIFATFAIGWAGAVMAPQFQLGGLQPQVDEQDPNDIYPVDIGGLRAQGAHVYASEGCYYCHTQQVRNKYDGTDIDRGWGARRSVARDYVYDSHAFLGSIREGPDLANIGVRDKKPGDLYRELYDPQSITPESTMPPYRYLFIKRRITGQRSVDALALNGTLAPARGWEIVPTDDAKALVGYLLTLDQSHLLKEAPQPAEAKKAK